MYTFVILKNDCIESKNVKNVMKAIENLGLETVNKTIVIPNRQKLENHYIEYKDKSFFNDLISRMENKEIVIMRVIGEDCIFKMRNLAGKADCSELGTLRNKYGKGLHANIIHTSANEKDACREINIWWEFFISEDVFYHNDLE